MFDSSNTTMADPFTMGRILAKRWNAFVPPPTRGPHIASPHLAMKCPCCDAPVLLATTGLIKLSDRGGLQWLQSVGIRQVRPGCFWPQPYAERNAERGEPAHAALAAMVREALNNGVSG